MKKNVRDFRKLLLPTERTLMNFRYTRRGGYSVAGTFACCVMLLSGLVVLTGCLTTKSFMMEARRKDFEAANWWSAELDKAGECAVVQDKDTPFPLHIVVKGEFQRLPMTDSELNSMFSGLPFCSSISFLNSGSYLTTYSKEHNNTYHLNPLGMIYPSDCNILCKARTLKDLKAGYYQYKWGDTVIYSYSTPLPPTNAVSP